jgi:hypothetical protein
VRGNALALTNGRKSSLEKRPERKARVAELEAAKLAALGHPAHPVICSLVRLYARIEERLELAYEREGQGAKASERINTLVLAQLRIASELREALAELAPSHPGHAGRAETLSGLSDAELAARLDKVRSTLVLDDVSLRRYEPVEAPSLESVVSEPVEPTIVRPDKATEAERDPHEASSFREDADLPAFLRPVPVPTPEPVPSTPGLPCEVRPVSFEWPTPVDEPDPRELLPQRIPRKGGA